MNLKKRKLGIILSLLLTICLVQATCADEMPSAEYTCIEIWGSEGIGEGQFDEPFDIAIDPTSQNVYVVDHFNHRIQKFAANGEFITEWGSCGTEEGQFIRPEGVTVDSYGNVYVSDTINARIQKFDADGTFLNQWGSKGSEDGQFAGPFGLTVDVSDNVYVADDHNNRVQKFTSNGDFLDKWGTFGTGPGEFDFLYDIALDSENNMYMVDFHNDRIQKLSASGVFIKEWGTEGTGPGEFDGPTSVAVDSSNNVYVVDEYNHRIQKFNSDGDYLTEWGIFGSELGEFNRPYTIAINEEDLIYVSDRMNNRIQVFDLNTQPTILSVTVPIDPQPIGSIINAQGIFIDPDVEDYHTAIWSWGDGSTSEGTLEEVTGYVSGSHQYAQEAGIYMVSLTIFDSKDADCTRTAEQYVVVYDPSEGFVTGAGIITSPEGAYPADPLLGGKAIFGFSSKYQKGATVPEGNTHFMFKAANFKFESDTYEWLVIAGSRAQFKGIGSINGAGNYGFMLTAIDGELKEESKSDKYRIKIWDKVTDTLIYDNQIDDPDDSEPATVIDGGSIVIHTTKK